MSLVLSRRPGESVRIGDDIEVSVLSVSGNHIRLGFTADKAIPIHRLEIYERIQREQEQQQAEPKTGPSFGLQP